MILQGEVPNPIEVPTGCRFHPRCPVAEERCQQIDPPFVQVSQDHKAACLLIESK
jgi:oligopeptide/dipeptide ABC transporter ATP-binding protein